MKTNSVICVICEGFSRKHFYERYFLADFADNADFYSMNVRKRTVVRICVICAICESFQKQFMREILTQISQIAQN